MRTRSCELAVPSGLAGLGGASISSASWQVTAEAMPTSVRRRSSLSTAVPMSVSTANGSRPMNTVCKEVANALWRSETTRGGRS
jgi:hypothetical protein